MEERIVVIASLIKEATKHDSLLGIYFSGPTARDLRMQFSERRHPDVEYERIPHDDVYDQMVGTYGGVEVFYLTDKDE